jgi:hypothetical protein
VDIPGAAGAIPSSARPGYQTDDVSDTPCSAAPVTQLTPACLDASGDEDLARGTAGVVAAAYGHQNRLAGGPPRGNLALLAARGSYTQ